MKSRILIIFSFLLFLWTAVLIRGAMVQIFPNDKLEALKKRQFETSLQIRTRRGAILDRNGKELAASVPSYSVFADPKMIKNPTLTAIRLGDMLGVSPNVLKKRIKDRRRRFLWIKRQISEAQMEKIKRWDEPGLGFIEEPKRVYPNGSLLAQTLGFVGNEGSGLEGLELQYDKYLRGQLKQVILPRDARGRPLLADGRALNDVPEGSDLELTIDAELQFVLEQELMQTIERFEAQSAMGIIVDAQTSEVLAMANVPTFDLNEALQYSAGPRRNRLVTDLFEPGSTFKTFLMAAALNQNIIRPNSRFFCENGRFKVGDKWINEAEVHEKFGWLTAAEILAYSSNIGTAKIAFELGDKRYLKAIQEFGFGQKTGIDLPGEARGLLNPLPWRTHLLSNVSFGQGISVTALQLVAGYTAIANGGWLKRPLLVRAIRPKGDEEPVEFTAESVRQVVTPAEAATLRMMLTAATDEKATGNKARIPGYLVAGKTGTAQKVDFERGGYKDKSYISSFAGFVPAHDPKYVIFVAVDAPKKSFYGAQVAAPVFAKMASYLVRKAGLSPMLLSETNFIPKNPPPTREALQARALEDLKRMQPAPSDMENFPDLIGLTLREAMVKMPHQPVQLDVKGHGVVVRTWPEAGTPLNSVKSVKLILENPN